MSVASSLPPHRGEWTVDNLAALLDRATLEEK